MPDLNGFNADDHESPGFEPLPKGDYPANITKTEWHENSKKNGRYMQFDLVVTDGPRKGHKLVDRLNLDHPNETAVRIANGTLADICRAVDVKRPRKSEEFHNKPLTIRVDVREYKSNDGKTRYSNDVKKYMAPGTTSEPAPTPAPEQSAETSGDKPPWATK